MRQQVITVHGGTSFDTRSDFLKYLSEKTLTVDDFKPYGGWKTTLQEQLGDAFEALAPRMPNSQNASYIEWATWMDRILSVVDDDVILIGHSLGAIFIAKYLCDVSIQRRVKATVLIATPYNATYHPESLKDFLVPDSLEMLASQAGQLHLVHSEDDPVVPFEELDHYASKLPDSVIHVFHDRQHFNQEEFPEMVELIRSL